MAQLNEESFARVASEFGRNISNDHAQAQYRKFREDILENEVRKAWYIPAKENSSPIELRAATIVWKIREHERNHLFGDRATEAIPGPETLDMGGQFLTNRDRIARSSLFRIAQMMPKGCHLHVHYNTLLSPQKIIERARDMETMFIRSSTPLIRPEDFDDAEIIFSVLPTDTDSANIFSEEYNPDVEWMRWIEFQKQFARLQNRNAEEWIAQRMVMSERDVYGMHQTLNGIWARFNQATRCFKGLFNYESCFRWYVGAAIDSMIQDNIMYAELRPMLLDKSISSDDGTRRVDLETQMGIIVEEVEKKKRELELRGASQDFPFGLKIIYCTPRSIPKDRMRTELLDCLKLKLQYPDLFCGFDLVGAEDRPNSIGFYQDELLAFANTCQSAKVDIPFMFHAGETLLDTGGSAYPANSNLYDTVTLHAKRVGHGFSLMKHPDLVEIWKQQRICVELCPLSNEILHLCRNVKEHPYSQLLAAGIPCTLNADNPSLFSSSLSHEFYQVMVGDPTMNLHGWRQFAEWSIEYSCLTQDEKNEARNIFRTKWERFCEWIVQEYQPWALSLAE